MIRTLVLTLALFLLLPVGARADEEVIKRYVPQAQEVGKGRLSFLFWDVYDIELYAPDGQWNPAQPFALCISYLRSLSGDDIAKRSADEIRALGYSDEVQLEQWYRKMALIFPDVDDTTMLIGVRKDNGQTVFYRDGRWIGSIMEPEFADWFFGIWLDENTPEPELREQLLGMTES